MMEPIATIAAALLGGVIGSLGAQWLGERYRRDQSRQATRRAVAVRHLVQLQDALESLWFRIHNLAFQGGRGVMESGYYETSSVYVIGYVLAHERLLTVEGAYAELDVFGDSVARDLDHALESLERAMGDETNTDVSFYRYQRRALADSLLKWDGVWRVVSYTEFAETARLEQSDPIIEPALKFIQTMTRPQARDILGAARQALFILAGATGLPLPDPISKWSSEPVMD